MESGQVLRRLVRRKSGAHAWRWRVLLVGIAIFGLLPFVSDVGSNRNTAHADMSVSYSVIAESCPDEVEEGDDFRIVLTSDDSGGHGDIRPIDGYWYTLARSADESDYEYLYGKHQKANEYQRRTSRMGRDFHTLEDNYSEKTERFVVYFNNKSDGGMDAECLVTIIDDDGAGVMSVVILSSPADNEAYRVGEDIMFKLTFNEEVYVDGYVSLSIQVGDRPGSWRPAVFNGYDTDALLFRYRVRACDLDLDGVSVNDGGFIGGFHQGLLGAGAIRALNGDFAANGWYRGMDDHPGHKVDGTS